MMAGMNVEFDWLLLIKIISIYTYANVITKFSQEKVPDYSFPNVTLNISTKAVNFEQLYFQASHFLKQKKTTTTVPVWKVHLW